MDSARTPIPEPQELLRHARDMVPRLAARVTAEAQRDSLPFGRVVADTNTGRQHVSNQPDYFGRLWGAMLLGGPAPLERLI